MKRFYDTVTLHPVGGGFEIRLDGKPLRTPARAPLGLPKRPLAEAIAEEWRAQGARLDKRAMPLTALASAAVDLTEREALIDGLLAYTDTDLLCYRAAAPDDLVARQDALWQPLVDGLAARHGVALKVGTGVMPLRQDKAAGKRLAGLLEAMDAFLLVAVQAATTASGSLVIGLAMAEGILDGERAWEAASLDEEFQAARWGRVKEAEAAARERQRTLRTAARMIRLLGR